MKNRTMVSGFTKFACILGLAAFGVATAHAQVVWGQSYIDGVPGVSAHGLVESYSDLGAFVEADAWMTATGGASDLEWAQGLGIATASTFVYLPQSGGGSVELDGYHWYDGGEFGWILGDTSSAYWGYSDPNGGGGSGGGGGSECVPTINGIVPSQGPGEGYLELYGSGFSTATSAYMPGSSYVSLIPVSDTQINASFGGLSMGSHTISVTNSCGTSNAAVYTVQADPTPVITSVAPSTWNAGQQYSVTISGSGFGTSPSVSIGAQGVSWSVQAANDVQINLLVTVASNASTQYNIPVTVTSNGYWGNGFQGGGQPQSQGGPTATVQGGGQGSLIINGSQGNVTNQTMTIMVGEASGAYAALFNGQPALGGSWQVPAGAFGGWPSTSTSSGSELPVSTNQNQISAFFFKLPGQRDLVYSVNINGTQYSTTVHFNVLAPTVTTQLAVGRGVAQEDQDSESGYGVWALHYGGGTGQQGITFQGAGTEPAGHQGGHFEWIQVINSVVRRRYSNGQLQATFNCQGLDGTLPYMVGNTTKDSPSQPLQAEFADNYTTNDNFSMYLMYRPTSPNGTLLVPVAVINWGWSGEATYIGSPWVGSGAGSPSGNANLGTTSAYPTWSGNSASCSWQ